MSICVECNNIFSFPTIEDLPDVAIGVVGGIASTCIAYYLEQAVNGVLALWDAQPTELQDAVAILKDINDIPIAVIKIALKILFFIYAVFIGPWLEELIFREGLHDWLMNTVADESSTSGKVRCVVLNGLAFGACHLSPYQGMMNVPVFVVTSAMGMLFEGLRMWRGNRVACTTAHMVHNGIALSTLLI